MTLKNKTVQKFISCFLIISVLSPAAFVLFSVPKKAQATIPVIDPALILKTVAEQIKQNLKEVIRQFLMKVARRLLDKMTQSTINWVNSGFHGKPLFLENPSSFFKDVVKEQVKGFINETGYDSKKFPFGKDFALGIIDQTKNTFEKNAAYSLSKMYADSAEFERQKNDFAAGGWSGLLLNTQLPQNNFIGYSILANEELSKRVAGANSPVQQIKDKVQQGLGFLSPQICKSNPSWDPDMLAQGYQKPPYNPPDPATDPNVSGDQVIAYDQQWEAQVAAGQAEFTAKYSCPEGPSNTTPGSIVSSQIMTALGSKQRQGELGAALGNSLAAIFDAILNHFMDKGLSSLSNFISPTPEPTISGFNYYGDTSGGYLGNPPTGSEPQLIVSVDVVNDNSGILFDSSILQVLVDGNVAAVDTPKTYTAGVHTVSMDNQTGYTKTISGDCAVDGTVTLVPNVTKNCKITLDDIPTGSFGTLTVTVNVINNNGGTATASSIPMFIDYTSKVSGVVYPLSFGNHIVSETRPVGYTATISGDCDADGRVTVTPIFSPTKQCVITNDDI